MMAIVSDIHGNLSALKSVFSELERLAPDRIISLGDVAGYYPQVNECVALLRESGAIHLMGNHDYYLVSGTGCPRSKTAQRFLHEQRKLVTGETLDWLGKSRVCYMTGEISMVHGGWRNPLDEYLYRLDEDYFSALPQRYFFSGHTHVQTLMEFEGGRVYCNPGSVGQPRDGNPAAAFALLDGAEIELRRVDYDIDAMVDILKSSSYGEYYYENLYQGTRIGGKVDRITRTTR